MLTCIAVLLICYIQIKEIYLFSFKKFVCIIKFHIFVYGHENEMYIMGVSLKEVECL